MNTWHLRTGFNLFAKRIRQQFGEQVAVVKHNDSYYVAGPVSTFDEDGHRLCVHGWYGEGASKSDAITDFWAKHYLDPEDAPLPLLPELA